MREALEVLTRTLREVLSPVNHRTRTLALTLTPTRWENFKHAPLLQLTTLKLNDNALPWDQKMFNEQVAMLKEKKLKHISLENNPFVDEVG